MKFRKKKTGKTPGYMKKSRDFVPTPGAERFFGTPEYFSRVLSEAQKARDAERADNAGVEKGG